jgi:hypothetical protein
VNLTQEQINKIQTVAEKDWEAWRPGFSNAPMPDIVYELCSDYKGPGHDVYCKRIFSCLLAEVGPLNLSRKLSDNTGAFQ